MSGQQERLIFAHTVEALLQRGLGGLITPQLKAELRTCGIDLDKPLLPAYPSAQWQKAVSRICATLYPDLPEEHAQFALGERTVYALQETFIGKAMVTLAKIVGPRRTMLKLPSTSKTGTNFSVVTVEELAPNVFDITHQPFEGHVEYMRGAFTAVIAISGGEEGEVRMVEHDPAAEKVVHRATWKA